MTRDKIEEANAQVCFLSDISQRGFNYSFDVLIIFANFFIKKKKQYIKESVFLLNLHNLDDFVGLFWKCTKLYEVTLARCILGSPKEPEEGGIVYRTDQD